MTKDELRKELGEYKLRKARMAVLEAEARKLEKEIERAKQNAAADMVSLGVDYSQGHGGGVGSPVERAALCAMDGEMSKQGRLWQEERQQRLAKVKEEMEKLGWWLARVEAALSALREAERVVVESHLIESESWTLLVCKSKRLLGETYSRRTIQSLQERALAKMLEVLA